VAKEPQGLSKADGKRPDGLTMVPWREGKPLTWDVTVVCPLAESYISDSATNAGSAAEAAATRKAAKYAGLERTHIFQPVAVENLHDERVSIRLLSRALVGGVAYWLSEFVNERS